jgi:hypothetical protein
VNQQRLSVGTTLLVIFFAGGALICLLVVLALAFPGGSLDSIWRLKLEAQTQFNKWAAARRLL